MATSIGTTCRCANSGITLPSVRGLAMVRIVLCSDCKFRFGGEDLEVKVDEALLPGSYITISGEFRMDTRGLTKKDILRITDSQPKRFRISATTMLDIPGYSKGPDQE